MEELRSTEILDKEIREDARKKAERILKNADSEAARIKSGVCARINEMRREKEAFYREKLQVYKDNCSAAVPLEKQRKEIMFFDGEIQKALTRYFSEIGTQKKLAIVAGFLKKFEPVIGSKKIEVRFSGFSKKEAETLIKKNFPKATLLDCRIMDSIESGLSGIDCGLIIEDKEHTFECRSDMNRARSYVLTEKRAEIKDVLFGRLQK